MRGLVLPHVYPDHTRAEKCVCRVGARIDRGKTLRTRIASTVEVFVGTYCIQPPASEHRLRDALTREASDHTPKPTRSLLHNIFHE
ncbi:hypothetical protein ACLOJK_011649 [Asimina triloba]